MSQKGFLRLYSKGVVLGHRRGQRNVDPNVSLLKIEGVQDTTAARWYVGKKVAWIYRAKAEKRGGKVRVIWGKIRNTHGSRGVVRAGFKRNLPPTAFGTSVRVMLYPSQV